MNVALHIMMILLHKIAKLAIYNVVLALLLKLIVKHVEGIVLILQIVYVQLDIMKLIRSSVFVNI